MSNEKLRRQLARLKEERAANVRCQTCAEGPRYIVNVEWEDSDPTLGPCPECGRLPLEVDVDWGGW